MLDLLKGVEAVKASGNSAELAKALGIARQAIYQWKRVPAERVLMIEQHTGVPRHVQRPDIYPQQAAE